MKHEVPKRWGGTPAKQGGQLETPMPAKPASRNSSAASFGKRVLARGQAHPLGATLLPGGANFSVYAAGATRLELLFYEHVDDDDPIWVIPLEQPTQNYWHVFISGVQSGQLYAYRAYGPLVPSRRHRFDADKVLIDPYGKAISIPTAYDRSIASSPGRNDQHAMKSVIVETQNYDWEGDSPLRRPASQSVIYECHVRGFTAHPNSGVAAHKRGTYAGLIEKIPYLKSLGITAVELMPVFQFDEQDAPTGLTNYWGYSPVSFFAPHRGYSSDKSCTGPLDEFRDMVKALHRAGIEVILDVVYNHTAEGDELGPTFCLRGLGNHPYYILIGTEQYANYSGTGNTLNANHAVVRRLILDSLRYWVREMHVDGFRFDLAAIMSRDQEGRPLPRPPIIFDIDTDPELAGSKLIAEAWDAAGLYQVGSFVGDFWREWNGKFRDDLRAFVRGDEGLVPAVISRVLASPDVYDSRMRTAERCINFICSHDGFTLNDLVSYTEKHNEANCEDNEDGENANYSWNHGVEGPSDDPAIENLRNRQIKNLLAVNLLSLGVPMILMGDEVRRTQQGNNNAYCQDNEVSWFDWSLVDRHEDVRRLVQELIRFRFLRDSVQRDHHLMASDLVKQAHVKVHGVRLNQPDTSRSSHSFAISASNLSGSMQMYFALNAHREALRFELPLPQRSEAWKRLIDTSLVPPEDVSTVEQAPLHQAPHYRVEAHSMIVLFTGSVSEPTDGPSL